MGTEKSLWHLIAAHSGQKYGRSMEMFSFFIWVWGSTTRNYRSGVIVAFVPSQRDKLVFGCTQFNWISVWITYKLQLVLTIFG